MYAWGESVRQDKHKAAALYTKACKKGDAEWCVLLGLMYRYGEGVEQDKNKATELFDKACESGNAEGCEWSKKLKETKAQE
jgi:TPR repeat protein